MKPAPKDQNMALAEEARHDKSFLLVPDTNVWVAYYTDRKSNISKSAGGYLTHMIKSGRVRIPMTVYNEVLRHMRWMRKEGRLAEAAEGRILERFGALYEGGRRDADMIRQRQPSCRRRAKGVYADIWSNRSEAAEAREDWARIKNGYGEKEWDSVSPAEREEMIAAGPPGEHENDSFILAAAAALAEVTKKKAVLLTADHDFLCFARWLEPKMGVRILSAYGPLRPPSSSRRSARSGRAP